jgi:hypothetical protein
VVKRVESLEVGVKPPSPAQCVVRAPRPVTTEKSSFVMVQKQRMFNRVPAVLSLNGEVCKLSIVEERERSLEMKRRVKTALALGIPGILKGLFRDGKIIDLDGTVGKLVHPVYVRRTRNECIVKECIVFGPPMQV